MSALAQITITANHSATVPQSTRGHRPRRTYTRRSSRYTPVSIPTVVPHNHRMYSGAALGAVLLLLGAGCVRAGEQYYGREVGRLSELHHGVRGRLYAVDSRTLFLNDFHYDGEGPAAFFYVGTGKSVAVGGGGGGNSSGAGAWRLRDERGGTGPLRRYRGEHVTLSLPEGRTLKDIKWFTVWCDEFSVNFGDVKIPRELEYPRPAKVGSLSGVHGVASDPVVVVDAQTLLVPNFSYDGEAPDAKFWVGRGERPSPRGIRIPDENGKEAPLRRYDRKTIVLTLPGELTVFDIGHFGVWCEAFTVDFGHVALPGARLANVPPSLKMLGVSPQSKLNCEVLQDDLAFEVRWAVAGDSIVLQLVAKLEDGEYMSFGVSGDTAHTQMVGGDVAVAWVEQRTLKGHAQDYYLDAKSQCAGVRGSCPDERLGEKTNSVRLLNAALVNGYSIVTYQRPLRATDELDRAVLTNASQPIVWAIGPLNSRNEVSYHSHFTKGDKFIEFGRAPVWNCPMPETEEEHKQEDKRKADKATADKTESSSVAVQPNPVPTPKPAPRVTPWEIPAIQCDEPADGVLYVQMGPTGGKQGYPAITGHVGWGISWYVNGLLIPELNVVRGKKYTFVTEGGSDPSVPARYHPFYITNDPVGGYFHKSDSEKQGIDIYAGVRRSRNGEVIPTGVGRLCNWTPDPSGPDADEYPSFGAYQRSLTLVCEEGNPGVVTWTPDRDTPDTVYYQCFTHRYLGWKINVLDECDTAEAEASQIIESVILPEHQIQHDPLQAEESIQVSSRVKPDNNFLIDQRKKVERVINTKPSYNEFNSDKPSRPFLETLHDTDTLTGEVMFSQEPPKNVLNLGVNQLPEYELPISKVQIKQVIQAVENLETQIKEDSRKTPPPPQGPHRHIVYPDIPRDSFLPEKPVYEEQEYSIEPGKIPINFMLPPNQRPLTLQSVMRPNGKPMGPMRPFRRPAPPEIKLRRPPYPKPGMGYPMPNHMPPHSGSMPPMKKPIHKYQNNRIPPGMNRPPLGPMSKPLPPNHGQKPMFNNQPPKTVPKVPNTSAQSIIVGKPATGQTLNLGQSDFIVNHVVKSHITLPSNNEPIAQHSSPQTYFNKPGQIILGKPMENPVPLDQQMIQTKPQVVRIPPTSPSEHNNPSTTLRIRSDKEELHPPSNLNTQSSDFLGQSTDGSDSVLPAVNTGFKADSIVVESGFKPIIREPLMASEDRITDFDGDAINRREDTDVEEDYEEAPQYINHAYPSDKMTQSFEPMFIPSPPDHILPTNDRTKEVFPSNHAKEDRPHPVYVKTDAELNALFSKQNMNKEVPSDMVMDADRVNAQYLPPDPKLPKEHSQKLLTEEQTFTTYDGKTVSASSLTETNKNITKIFSSKLPANSELLLKSPQFGPFKGEIPPIIAEQLDKKYETNNEDVKNDFYNSRTTQLKLVNSFHNPDSDGELKAEGSEVHEVVEEVKIKEDDTEEGYDESDDDDNDEEEEDDQEEENGRLKRDIKATHFEAGQPQETSTNGYSQTRNQVDFDVQNENIKNASTKKYNCWTTHFLLFVLWLKCF